MKAGVLFARGVQQIEPFGAHFTDYGERTPGQHHMDVAAAAVNDMVMARAIGCVVMIIGIPMGMAGVAGGSIRQPRMLMVFLELLVRFDQACRSH